MKKLLLLSVLSMSAGLSAVGNAPMSSQCNQLHQQLVVAQARLAELNRSYAITAGTLAMTRSLQQEINRLQDQVAVSCNPV